MKQSFRMKLVPLLILFFSSNILFSQNILLEEKVLIGSSESNIMIDDEHKTIAIIDSLESGYQITHFDINSGAKRIVFIDSSLLPDSHIYGLYGDSIIFNTDVRFVNIRENGIAKMNIFTLEKKTIQAKHLESKIVQGYYLEKRPIAPFVEISTNDLYTNEKIESVLIPDTLDYEFIAHSDSTWILGLSKGTRGGAYFFKEDRWSPFTYPINDSTSDHILEVSILNDDSLIVVSEDDTSRYVSMFTINENLLESDSDSIDKIRIGTFDFFMRKQVDTNAVVKVDYSKPKSGLGQVVPVKEDVTYEVEKQKGAFSLLFQKFRDAEDAYSLLNSLLKVFPKAFTSKKGDDIEVHGPRRTSLRDIEADSIIAVKNDIPVFSMDSADYSNWSSSEVMVTFSCIDSKTIKSLPVTIFFYNRSTGKLILQDTVVNGRVRFIYPIESDLGVTLNSEGHYPKSIRLNPAESFSGKSIYRQVIFQEIEKDAILAPQLNFQNILFDFDSDEIKKVSLIELNSIKQVFDELGEDASITIEGHADSVGSDKYNYKLAERRAAGVMKYFSEKNSAILFQTKSKGEKDPLMSNSSEFGRSVNRRVVIIQDSSEANKVQKNPRTVIISQDTIDLTLLNQKCFLNMWSHNPLISKSKYKFNYSTSDNSLNGIRSEDMRYSESC